MGGLPTEATLAHVLVSKYADHLPLYRQSQILARAGLNLHRAVLADWVGKAAFHLKPIVDQMAEHMKRSGVSGRCGPLVAYLDGVKFHGSRSSRRL